MAQFHIRAGVSSLALWMAFPNKLDEEGLDNISDYIHSENLSKNLDFTVSFCVHFLMKTKYFPGDTKAWIMFGEPSNGSSHNVQITGWEDYQIVNFEGEPLYTKEILSEAEALGDNPLATALFLIVKDMCDDGRIMSEDWYGARMVLEYYREDPVPPENAFLIGMLHKELCVKQAYEVDLTNYYKKLAEADIARRRGANTTREKGLELRALSVDLFIALVEEVGPPLWFASPIEQAKALRKAAIGHSPAEFMRDGKPLSEQWFLKHVIEDRKAEIVAKLSHLHRPKKA